MLSVIPVFLTENDQCWREAPGSELMQCFFQMAGDTFGSANSFVLSDDHRVLDAASRQGLQIFLLEIENKSPTLVRLPLGSYESIRYLEQRRASLSDEVMVLNFKNPLIHPALIKEAIKNYQSPAVPVLFSVIKAADHPCQLHRCYTIADLGFIHFRDQVASAEDYLDDLNRFYPFKMSSLDCSGSIPDGSPFAPLPFLSKPFYFDWQSKAILQKNASGIFIRNSDGFKIRYIPLEQAAAVPLDGPPKCFWLYEGPESARILYTTPLAPDLSKTNFPFAQQAAIWGASFDQNYSDPTLWIFKNSADRFFLFISDGGLCFPAEARIRLAPIGPGGLIATHCQDLYPLKQFHDLHLDSHSQGFSGIIYSILGLSRDRAYQIDEPFPPQDDLWKMAEHQGINMQTGKPIFGRQDFPDVFEPDGSFWIFNIKMLDALDALIAQGNASGFVLNAENSINLNSEWDWLRYRARLKAHDATLAH